MAIVKKVNEKTEKQMPKLNLRLNYKISNKI